MIYTGAHEVITRKVGEKVTLACDMKFKSTNIWSHIPEGNKNRITIFTGDRITDDTEYNDRFRLDSANGKYDLSISDLRKLDAGIYFCEHKESENTIQLIIESK